MNEDKPSAFRSIVLPIIFILLALVAMIVIMIFKVPRRPWIEERRKTHLTFSDSEKAAQTLGRNLLIERMLVGTPSRQEYTLHHSGKDASDRSTWNRLNCTVYYREENKSLVFTDITVYFSWDERTLTDFKQGEYEEIRIADTDAKLLKTENSYPKLSFVHNGYLYELTSDDYELLMKTAQNMLDGQ